MFTLIIGGSASGKSEYAEQQVLALDGQRVYLATLEPWDDECRVRIRRHQEARAARGFQTMECYRGLDELTVPENANILLDGLGNLVAGELYHPDGRGTAAILAGVDQLRSQCRHLTIVADEVFSGGQDYAGDTLRYLREMGRLHCDLAQRADRVVEVVAGIPNILKDTTTSIPNIRKDIPTGATSERMDAGTEAPDAQKEATV